MLKEIESDIISSNEMTALSASKLIGKGDVYEADKVATETMRKELNKILFFGKIVLSEGEKDNAPMLKVGEHLGRRPTPKFDLVVDPLDGTKQTSKWGREAVSLIAVAEEFVHIDSWYMYKIAVGKELADLINKKDFTYISDLVKKLKDKKRDISFCMLDRPRNDFLLNIFKEYDCKVKLIPDCDVSAAILTSYGETDVYIGIGGSTEGVIAATALKCLGGKMIGIPCDKEGRFMGDPIDSFVKGEMMVVVTGVTNGSLVSGVTWEDGLPTTHTWMVNQQGERRIRAKRFGRF